MIIKKNDISSIFPIIIKIIKLNFEVVSKLAKSISSIPNIAEVVVLVIVKIDNLDDNCEYEIEVSIIYNEAETHQSKIVELQKTIYKQSNIHIPIIYWNGSVFMRVSIQAYNTESDINKMFDMLEYFNLL